MNRHSLICRFDPADKAKVKILQPDSAVTEIYYVPGLLRLEYGLGQFLDELEAFGLRPSETAFDLALLATLVFCADTRISRSIHSQDGWTREIDLYLPVQNKKMWEAVAPDVSHMLGFLTGDRWRLFFRGRPRTHRKCTKDVQQLEFPRFDSVSLFSGGLDSYIGAIDLLKEKGRPLLVSHYWDGITSDHQKMCLKRLAERFPNAKPESIRARVGFGTETIKDGGKEDTQRSRSFLFFAFGALAASGLPDGTRLFVPENGLISLNVPLDPLRVGSLSTRTTHPYFMERFQEVLAKLDIAVSLANPYRHKTKGEMVEECKDRAFLGKTAADTMSCSAPTKGRWLKLAPMHCGYCVPCLIRRASLLHGLGKDSTKYQIPELADRILDSRKAEGRDVRSFQLALMRLRKNPAFARTAILIPGPLSEFLNELPAFEAMYVRGMNEVGALLKNVEAAPL